MTSTLPHAHPAPASDRLRMGDPLVTAVLPVFNKRDLVRASAESVIAAARHGARAPGDVEVVFVDHQSTDGAHEVLVTLAAASDGLARVVRKVGGTISSVRNAGAREARGTLVSFLDSDVVVPPDYFQRLVEVQERTGAEALGCEVDIPTAPHWTERVWHQMHRSGSDGDRHYLNAANFAVRRDALERVGGWAEHLAVGEDTDICRRLLDAGCRIHESHALNAVHLGNPKTVRAFFRREVWHGISVLDDPTLARRSRMTWMVYGFVATTVAAALLLLVPSPLPLAARGLGALALSLAVPTVAVAFRVAGSRRLVNPVPAVALYAVYFAARARALAGALAGRRR